MDEREKHYYSTVEIISILRSFSIEAEEPLGKRYQSKKKKREVSTFLIRRNLHY